MTLLPRPARRRRPDFSLATINIVFLLLLFFLMAGSIVQKAESTVDIPLASKLPLENLPRPLLVVTYGDQLFLDGEPITLAELGARAGESLALHPGGFVNVLAERDLPARPLLDVLGALGAAALPARLVTVRQEPGGAP